MNLKTILNNKNSNVHKSEIAKGAIYTFSVKGIGIVLNYVLIYIINENYGHKGFGIYSLFISSLLFLSYVGSIGLNVSLLRYIGQFNSEISKGHLNNLKRVVKYAYQIVLVSSLALSGFLFVFSETISIHVLDDVGYKEILKFTAFIAPLYIFHVINVELLRGLKKILLSEVFRSTLLPLICIVVLTLFSSQFKDDFFPSYVYGFAVLIVLCISLFTIGKKLNFNLKTIDSSELKFKELMNVSSAMLVSGLGVYLIDNIGLFLIQGFYDEEAVGIFSIVMKFTFVTTLILTGINTISAPKFSELFWLDNQIELKNAVAFSAKILFYLSTPIFLILILFPEELLGIFSVEAGYAARMLIIISIGQYVNVLSGSVGLFLNMTGNQKVNRNIILLTTFMALILNYVLIQYMGIVGIAWATMISLIFLNASRAIYIYKKFKIKMFYVPFSK